MVHTVSDTRDTPLLGTPIGNLVLRVGGSGPEGQTVQIASAKCTVGSGRNCTLRLHQAGVRPLHCLILRGAIGTVVRNWAPGTRLNGAAFTDSPLRTGDRLHCGSVELEVLDPQGPPNGTWHGRRSEFNSADGGGPRETPGPSAAPATATAVARLRAAVGHTRTRSRRLVKQLRQARDRAMQVDSLLESEKARSAWAADHLRLREETHTADREKLVCRITELEEAVHGAESTRQKLADEFGAEAARHRAAVQELEAMLRSTEGQLEAEHQAQDELHDAIGRLRADYEQRGGDWNKRLAKAAQESDEQAARIHRQEEEIQTLQGQLRRSLDRPPAQEHGRQVTAAAAAMAGGDSANGSIDAGDAAPTHTDDVEPLGASGGEPVDANAVKPAGASGGGSIEDYFQRLVGHARREATRPSGCNAEPAMPVNVPSAAGVAGHGPSPSPVTANPGAGDAHTHTAWFLTGVGKLSVAAAGIIAGVMVLAMFYLQSPRTPGPHALPGIIALLIAVVWGVQGAAILRRIRQSRTVRSISETP